MEPEIIIVAVILSSIVVGSIIWLKKSIQDSRNTEMEELQTELNEKRDIAAQVPLLNKAIEDMHLEQKNLSISLDEFRTALAQKDVTIAENKKDRISLADKIEEMREGSSTLKAENSELIKSIELLKTQLQTIKGELDKKDHEVKQSKLTFEKDMERFNSKNDDLEKESIEIKNELLVAKKKIDKLTDENTNLQADNSKLKADLNAQRENSAEFKEHHIVVQKELDSTKNKSEDLTLENSDLKAVKSALQADLNNLKKSSMEAKDELQIQIKTLKTDLLMANDKIETLLDTNSEIRAEKSKFQADLEGQQEGNKKLKTDFEEQSKRLELKLNEIMQHNLDSKLKKFDETSMKSLDGLFKPFKENLDSFKKKVEDSQENSTKKFAELSKEIEQVTKAGMNISKEAESLTKALKGKKQTQGSWGEMILESVLEYSGLLKGVHYETQESYRDEEGQTKRPDVVIKLPQERTIIIDSKVSLNDYDKYIRSETDEERVLSAKAIAAAFKNHIDILDSKDYAHYRVGTLQYVFMFVPIEGAFAMAIQQDPSLYEYALKKHIAIVNPSTLTVSLRTIYLYWQSEQSSTLATKLFDDAGKLYDKMVGFSDNFRKIGSQLQTATNTYDLAHKQLTEGTGNLMGRVENLKLHGARTSKTLKSSKIEFQDFDDAKIEVKIMEEDDQPLALEGSS